MTLRIRPREFMRMCPRYFATLVRQQERMERRRENRKRVTDGQLAQLIAMVANTGFRGWQDERLVAEFLPSYPDAKEAARTRRPSQRQVSNALERTMERAMRYQAAQQKSGATE